jgi:hypothetical protein
MNLPQNGPPLVETILVAQIQQQAETNRLLARLVDALYQTTTETPKAEQALAEATAWAEGQR